MASSLLGLGFGFLRVWGLLFEGLGLWSFEFLGCSDLGS